MEKEDYNYYDDDMYTPQSIALKLINDDNIKKLSTCMQLYSDVTAVDNFEICCMTFETLLSIFLEMLIIMMKNEIVLFNEENNSNIDVIPDFENFNMDMYAENIENKIKNINYIISIETYDKNDKDFIKMLTSNRYSRVLLRHSNLDKQYFVDNYEEYYDFVLNSGFVKSNKLSNIFSILIIGDNLYKIFFSEIEKKINDKQHLE
jgi:hypothetical protein